MGFRFQKRISILPGLRINLSKSGASASLGPRGADVNIGRDGVTANAGLPGTGLSYRQKVSSGHKGWIAALVVLGGLAIWTFQHRGTVEKAVTTVIAQPSPAPVNTIRTAIRYVHRAGSVLRAEPRASAESLKKEAKGAQVTLISESGGWAKVTDGNMSGYMRASVLRPEPPQ